MKLKRFKERDNKRIGIIVFTISCILLVSGVILYRTFAIFEVKTNQNVIKGTVQDPGNIYFAFYKKNEDSGDYEIQKDMPSQDSGLVLDEEKSYCGVNGEKNPSIKVTVNEDWKIIVSGITTSRTKCNLYFTKGIFLMGHEVPVVTSGDGLYEIKHENINNTVNDVGFKKSEYRYAGASPNNYITFNNELWRIIGIVNVMTDTSTVEQRVKIIRDKPLGAFAWDFNEKNDWTQATLMEMLNNGYYNSMSNFTCYIGKNNDTKVVESSICDFSQGDMKGLNKLAQNQIEEVIWNISGEEFKDGELVIKLYYEKERGTKVYDTQPYLWSKSNSKDGIFHSIAIIYPSDYAYATSGGEKGQDYCLGFVFNSWNLGNEYSPVCIENDWLKNDEGWRWFLFNNTLNDKNIYYSSHVGYVRAVATSKFGYLITPTLYLKTNVKIISGTGSPADAFEIAQVIK